MGLPWVRLDTQFASNPKILELATSKRWRSAFVYVAALAYSGQHSTDGYLPDTCLPFIHATSSDANALVEVGLWKPVVGGWEVNGWDEFQISDEAAKRRRERAQKGAAARWEKAKQRRLRGV